MASEGGGGADLVGFIIGLIIFGALAQGAMVQIGKLTNPSDPAATTVPVSGEQPASEIPTATSTTI